MGGVGYVCYVSNEEEESKENPLISKQPTPFYDLIFSSPLIKKVKMEGATNEWNRNETKQIW